MGLYQAQGLKTVNSKTKSHLQFLNNSSTVLATTALSSAICLLVLANWLQLSTLGQMLLLNASLALWVLLTWCLARKKPQNCFSSYSWPSLGLVLAIINVGGLLALADAHVPYRADWQWFVVWAVLLMPWLVGLASLFIILFVLVLANIALFTYLSDLNTWLTEIGWEQAVYMGAPTVLNGLVLLFNVPLATYFNDQRAWIQRWTLGLMSGWYIGQILLYGYSYSLILSLLAWVFFVGLSAVYFWRRQDGIVGAMLYLTLFVLSGRLIDWLYIQLGWESYLIFLPLIVLGFGLVWHFRQQLDRAPRLSVSPWFLKLFFTFIHVGMALSWVWVLNFYFRLELSSVVPVYVVIACLWAVGLGRSASTAKNSSFWHQDLPLFLVLSSIFMVLYPVWIDDELPWLWRLVFMVLSLVVYYTYASRAYLVAFFSAGAFLSLLLFSLSGQWFATELYSLNIQVAVYGFILLMLNRFSGTTYADGLKPLQAAVILGLIVNLIVFGFLTTGQVDYGGWEALIAWGCALVWPVLLARLIGLRSFHSLAIIVVALLLSGWGLFAVPLANVALALGLSAYARTHRKGAMAALVLLVVALGLHLSLGDQRLLQAAQYLFYLAVGFGVLSLLFYSQRRALALLPLTPAQTVAQQPVQSLAKKQSVALWLGLIWVYVYTGVYFF